MTERSYFWGGTTIGDATLAEYTDDDFSDRWAELFTIDRATQGVIYTERVGYTGMLAVTKVDDDNVAVDTGLALVDGKVYENDASLNLGVGGDGFYRVVLRKTWAAQTVRAVLLGPQAVTPPSVTQTDGTTWEISLATFEKAAGVIGSIVDTRAYVNLITTTMIVDDAVDDTKAGNRVPQFYRRQGGDANAWNVTGSTDYTPTAVRMQAGIFLATIADGTTNTSVVITFPVAFSSAPIVYASMEEEGNFAAGVHGLITEARAGDLMLANYTTKATFKLETSDDSSVSGDKVCTIAWLAIGPE